MFYWFRSDNGSLTKSRSYFQVTSNRCSLSCSNANASSSDPVQIYMVANDSVFILTYTKIERLKESSVKIASIMFEYELYDPKKRADEGLMYYLDEFCR
jgi:hypothetical protein